MDLENFDCVESGMSSFYRCRALDGIAGLRHGFSTRHVADHAGFVHDVGLDPGLLVPLAQIHSDSFHIIEELRSVSEPALRGDALISAGLPVAVRVADCFPVLIADPDRRCVAAVHSGWRGTLTRILAKTIRGMSERFGSRPSSLLVVLGPAIRSCCYEVGSEVADAFSREYPGIALGRPHPKHPGKTLLDLRAALESQLDDLGVARSRVFDLGACTGCRTDLFFSFRSERERAGRLMAVIGLCQI